MDTGRSAGQLAVGGGRGIGAEEASCNGLGERVRKGLKQGHDDGGQALSV